MKKVIITGASRGLGKAIKERLEEPVLSGGFNPQFGKTIEIGLDYEVCDWSRSTGTDLTKRVPVIVTQNVDILILNAGIWKNNWRLNYEAPRELAEQMPKDKLVIFILSNAAYQSYGNDDYTASKSGLLHYLRRKQAGGFNFSSISPGTINTGFWEGAEVDHRKRGAMAPEAVAELVYQIIKSAENGVLVRELIVTPWGGAT